MNKISFVKFKFDINEGIKSLPKHWRKGQKVFNYIDQVYGVARTVQFEKHIDCFHDDRQIEAFIKESYEVFKNNNFN